MINGYCCCTNTAYNRGKFCSLESDCLGSAAAASPPPPSPPPPSPTASQDGCCSTVSVVLTGAASSRWWAYDGQYTMTSTTQNGRAVYAHTSGSTYLFFWASDLDWHVWNDYTVNIAGLTSTGDDNTQCPEDEGDSWRYYDYNVDSWFPGGIEVKCVFTPYILSPPPPLLPPPPSPSRPPSSPPSSPPLLYQVLTTDGATCPAGTEITSLAECSAAIAEANAAMGASGSGTVGTESYSFNPKGCYTGCYSDYSGYFYFCGHFNNHATGDGTGTATGTDQYVHCLLTPVLSPPSPPPTPSPPPPPKALIGVGASNVETGSDSSSLGGIIGGVIGGLALLGAVGAGLYYFKVKKKKPPASAGGGQAQGGVTLSAPAQSADESKI